MKRGVASAVVWINQRIHVFKFGSFKCSGSMGDSLAVDNTTPTPDASDARRKRADTFVHVFLVCCLVRLFFIAVRLIVVFG